MHTKRIASVAVTILLLVPASLHAAETTITVDAAGHDRHQTPVRVPLVLTSEHDQATTATLVTEDGRRLPAQITKPSLLAKNPLGKLAGTTEPLEGTRELHFILPSLAAGETLTLCVELGGDASGDASFRWSDTPGEYSELQLGSRPVLRYMYRALDESSAEAREQTYKVFHHVYDPSGSRIVTKGPGGLYTHHRGLFFGFNRITYGDGRTADTWHARGDAHQSHRSVKSAEAGPVLGRHRVAIDWHGQDKEVFAREQREMTVYNVPQGLLIEFASRLKPTDGPVRLDGDPQHAGFQFRAHNDVAEKTEKQTYYLRPSGKGAPGETYNWPDRRDFVNLPWNAMSFVLDDQRYTVCYLDRPENPKEARFSERSYGRFGSYFEYDLTEENPLELNYRVWLQAGEMTADEVARLATDFVEPVQVTVSNE